jgi:molecular chaperone DnaJ
VAHKGGHGDLLVSVEVQVPTELTAEARAAVEALREATGERDLRAKLFEGSR